MHSKVIHFIIVLFLILGINIHSQAQDTLTVGEIYDFNIGDEFHFRTRHDGIEITENWMVKKAIDVQKTSNSTVYVFQTIDSNYNIDTLHLDVPDLALEWTIVDSIDSRKNGWIDPSDTMHGIDSTYIISTVRDTMFANRKATYLTYSDGVFDGAYYLCTYAGGLGKVKSYISTLSGGWFFELVYYKKGNEEWGIPVHVKELGLNNIEIYPNPTAGVFTVQSINLPIAALSLFDLQGRMIAELDPTITIHDISDIAPGTYILWVQSEGNTVHLKLILQ